MKRSFLLGFVIALAVSTGLPHQSPAATDLTEPVIEAINGKVVRVRVPTGFDRVTLQQKVAARARVRGGGEAWRTVGTHYARGLEGVAKFRLSTFVGKRFLRVLGNRTESLPGHFFTGITEFLPDPLAESEATFAGGKMVSGDGLLDSTGSVTASATGSFALANGGGSNESRAVSESDIWRVQGDRLYFFNELRGLQVLDLAKPENPVLLGTLRLPGSGDQMYLLGDTHALLLKRASNSWRFPFFGGGVITLRVDLAGLNVVGAGTLQLSNSGAITSAGTLTVIDGASLVSGGALSLATDLTATRARAVVKPQPSTPEDSELIVAEVRAGAPELVARVPIKGSIVESRLVGSVLYVASNAQREATENMAAQTGLQITSFDLADPANPVERASIFLGGWASAVTATDRFFLVAKYGADWRNHVIDLIDISSPDGAMQQAGQVTVEGTISSKFNLSIHGDVLSAVTQNWGAFNDDADPEVEWLNTSFTSLQTFSIADPQAPAPLGRVDFAPRETMRSSRFDGQRAYVVTFRQIDPLFVIDLKNPAHPTISGEVEAPGFSTYIEPLGDRLVTVGLVDWRPAVSLFDVSNPAEPRLLTQLKLGDDNGWLHSEAVWNEKAFKVLPEQNLILLPVTGAGDAGGWFSRVQLIDLLPNQLVKRGAIEHSFSPRRATVVKKSIVAISPTRLVTVDAENRDQPIVKADLEIAWSVERVFQVGTHLVQLGGSAEWSDGRPPTLSVSPSAAPDDLLNKIELPNLPVRGTSLKDGVLYIAQGEPSGYDYWGNDGADIPKKPLRVTACDLTRLPALSVLGETSIETQLGYGGLSAHWPSPGVLVWSGLSNSRSWWGRLWIDPVAYAVPANDGTEQLIDPTGYWWTRWFYTSTTRLLAFDVTRPQAPKFLSDVKVGGGEPWQLSPPFEAAGQLYLSYKFPGKVHPASTYSSAAAAGELDADDPALARANRHYLVRVDYAMPKEPVIDDTDIALPGTLRGLARAGLILYTTGQSYGSTAADAKSDESALHASAFDGAAVHLLDTLPLRSPTQPLSISGSTIFALDPQPAYLWNRYPFDGISHMANTASLRGNLLWWGGSYVENSKLSTLAKWRLGDDGKFVKLGEIEAAHDISLHAFGDLLVTFDGSRKLQLFDGSIEPLERLGDYSFDGWVWPQLEYAAGGLETGLWVPLGNYGVEAVAGPAPSAN